MFHSVRSGRVSFRLLVLAGLLVLAASTSSVWAATDSGDASVSGVVLDPDGRVIADSPPSLCEQTRPVIRTRRRAMRTAALRSPLCPRGSYVIEVSAPGFAVARRSDLRVAAGKTEDLAVTLSVGQLTEEVNVSPIVPAAAKSAPSQGSLSARSAQSIVSSEFIRNYTSPVADYTQVIQMAPGTFSLSPNGVGLGDSKTYFRGFQDGYYNITFDGIPFNDTNSPTHHSWAFFPGQFIGSTVFDRSPGSASTIGPTTYGGSVNLLSRKLPAPEPVIPRDRASYGSFSTSLLDARDSSGFGQFGPG